MTHVFRKYEGYGFIGFWSFKTLEVDYSQAHPTINNIFINSIYMYSNDVGLLLKSTFIKMDNVYGCLKDYHSNFCATVFISNAFDYPMSVVPHPKIQCPLVIAAGGWFILKIIRRKNKYIFISLFTFKKLLQVNAIP